jgi:hypothetical protein
MALETLLGEPCYHMYETIARRVEHVPLWLRVFNGDVGVANESFDGFAAAVDWPTSTVRREMAELYPDVPVVLTRRTSADAWWQSASKTVFPLIKTLNEDEPVDIEFGINMMSRLRTDVELADAAALKAIVDDEAGMKAAYERHLAEVELAIDPARLVNHQPGDGWEPLCEALGLPVPDEPYPHSNTADDFNKFFEENPI